MKINNINKRLLAGVLGGIILTTPLTLTACNSYEYVTEEDGSIKLDPNRMYSYNDVKDLRIINVKTKINENLYLAYSESYFFNGIPIDFYYTFTVKEIIINNSNVVIII